MILRPGLTGTTSSGRCESSPRRPSVPVSGYAKAIPNLESAAPRMLV